MLNSLCYQTEVKCPHTIKIWPGEKKESKVAKDFGSAKVKPERGKNGGERE